MLKMLYLKNFHKKKEIILDFKNCQSKIIFTLKSQEDMSNIEF